MYIAPFKNKFQKNTLIGYFVWCTCSVAWGKARLLAFDMIATVTPITTPYNQSMQMSVSECRE